MKVCTDACLFGAWAAADAQIQSAKNILDIGSGTGLLSLMLAQQSNAHITAIEIEDGAFHQTEANFNLSPWKDRLNVVHSSIQDYAAKNKENLF